MSDLGRMIPSCVARMTMAQAGEEHLYHALPYMMACAVPGQAERGIDFADTLWCSRDTLRPLGHRHACWSPTVPGVS
jgi:hypothetical protein